jgi:hypothetical protein
MNPPARGRNVLRLLLFAAGKLGFNSPRCPALRGVAGKPRRRLPDALRPALHLDSGAFGKVPAIMLTPGGCRQAAAPSSALGLAKNEAPIQICDRGAPGH